MRVCHIIGSFRPVIGGAERATETLVGGLVEQGADVIVLTRRYSAADPAHETVRGASVHRLGLPGRSKLHALTFGLHALAVLALRFRGYRILHVQDIDTSTFVGMLARLLPGRRLVTTIHGDMPIVGRSRSWRGRLRVRGMVRATDTFTSINPENTRVLVGAGASRERIREVPNGVDELVYHPPSDEERAEARASLGLEADEFVALYLGRLHPIKRVDLLIDAWAQRARKQRSRLVIVGGGSEDERLRRQASGDESIRFDGPTDEAVRYFRAADIFVNPSDSEGLSVATLEASFVGLLPIVTVCPGNDVIVQDGRTGLNFPVGDRDGLLACLDTAAADEELRLRIGQQAHDAVVGTYSIEAVAREMCGIYRELEGAA